MDSKTKLKRFCFLGSFDPVYIHLRGDLDVNKYWPIVEELVKELDNTVFLPLIREVLHESCLVRRDEVLFIYAAYLASSADIKWRTDMRQAFPILIRTDDDLFLFCKYAMLIAREQNRNGFSRTVRKAITAWYEIQTPEAIRTMWLAHRGLHGYTHKALIKLCHISDATIGSSEVVTPFFKTCIELIKEAGEKVENIQPSCSGIKIVAMDIDANDSEASTSKDKKIVQQQTKLEKTSTESTTTSEKKVENIQPSCSGTKSVAMDIDANISETSTGKDKKIVQQQTQLEKTSTESTPTSIVVAIAKLRLTEKKHEAIKIIRKFKLPYTQVPGHLLQYPVVMEAVLPSMSYLQVLKYWRRMVHFHHFDNNPKVFKICKKMLENKELAKKSNVYPIHLLMKLRQIGISDLRKIPTKRAIELKADYLEKLYKESFQWHTDTGKLRMHITVNLQKNYKKKFLKNHKKLSYYDALIALAFGYSKRESKVDVFHWYEDKMKLKRISFEKDYSTNMGLTAYDLVENLRNNQRLVTPLLNALSSEQVYDVFLCIVPTAGRGNPKQSSDFLCKFLDKYRETKNPNAKFIILNLLKFKRSMSYSETRSQNILEICGLDEHTTDIINNFVINRFE